MYYNTHKQIYLKIVSIQVNDIIIHKKITPKNCKDELYIDSSLTATEDFLVVSQKCTDSDQSPVR